MNDLISRADAIEALGEEPEIILDTDAEWEMHDRWVDAMQTMKALSSAVCDDCIWHVCNYNKVDWDALPSAETHEIRTETHGVCLISKDDAIEAVCDVVMDEFNTSATWGYDVAEKALEALPSAEAVQGEWTDIDNYYRLATCSHCHKVTMFEKWGEYTQPYNFCPNCGARMKGGAE